MADWIDLFRRMGGPLIVRMLAALNLALAATMVVPVVISLAAGENDWPAFLGTMALSAVFNGTLLRLTSAYDRGPDLNHRSGLIITGAGWFVSAAQNALPFYIYAQYAPGWGLESFVNAYFETVSGMTTTGATILSKIEALPHGILWWRSIIQWYGGLGIIVMSVAVLPLLGAGGVQMMKAESSGFVKDKFTPRLRDTARGLWRAYIVLTLVITGLLMVTGFSLFDALCHAFTALATGGFSTRDVSVMAYDNPWAEIVLELGMIAGGISFVVHHRALRGDFGAYREREVGVFLGLTAALVALVTWGFWHSGATAGFWQALRHAAFNVISLTTCTGFNSSDFEKQAALSAAATLGIVVSLLGFGMAGSTGGGVKAVRWYLLWKMTRREVFRLIHPHGVQSLKIAGAPVTETVGAGVAAFFFLYIATAAASTLLLTLMDVDGLTALTASLTCLANAGPGLGAVGPLDNFQALPPAGRWLMCFVMIAGRLELFTLYALFVPEFWRR